MGHIARDVGFGEAKRMYEVFRRELGVFSCTSPNTRHSHNDPSPILLLHPAIDTAASFAVGFLQAVASTARSKELSFGAAVESTDGNSAASVV